MEVQVSAGNGSPAPGLVIAERQHRPDPEVPEKGKHRRFSAQEKRRILLAAEEAVKVQGGLGALLRREGIYSSHLYLWRKQRERGEIEGLSPKKRGKKSTATPEEKRLRALEKQNRRLQRKLKKAELIIEVQKKLSEILNVPLPPIPPDAEEEDD